jgi:phosphate starvation-inducible PhoH-like protein
LFKPSKHTNFLKRGLPLKGKSPFAHKETRMSKKRNKNRQQQRVEYPQQQPTFTLREIRPLTVNQSVAFNSYKEGFNFVLHGYAGTGKTFISTYLGLNEICSGQSPYEKLIFIRSVVPCRDMGFLPGTEKEKSRVYEEPYREICADLFDTKNAYDILKMQNLVDFTTTSFLRGMTFNNCILLFDEVENFTFQELDTVITRVGKNCRVMVCGDFRQTDLRKSHEKSGILDFMKITNSMRSFQHIEFEKEDIVRSSLVREYIIKKYELQDQGLI